MFDLKMVQISYDPEQLGQMCIINLQVSENQLVSEQELWVQTRAAYSCKHVKISK